VVERRGFVYLMWALLVKLALDTPCLLPLGMETSSYQLPLGWGGNRSVPPSPPPFVLNYIFKI
jgi:hypothetical protein